MGNEPKFWDSVEGGGTDFLDSVAADCTGHPCWYTHPRQACGMKATCKGVRRGHWLSLFGEDMDFDAYGGKAF